MTRLARITKGILHVGTLAFTAWWLVADSAPAEPARDCFTGIGTTARLRVVIGAPVSSDAGALPSDSCRGVDGLAPGAVLTLDVVQPAQRPVGRGGLRCFGYQTAALQGLDGVSLNPATTFGTSAAFTTTAGTFSSTRSVGCRGGWGATIYPDPAPADGQLVSPLDASAAHRWIVNRYINLEQAQFCDSAFTDAGAVSCSDFLFIESIEEISP